MVGIRTMLCAAAAVLALPAQAADRCDRACLEGFVDRYVEAVAAHDPGRLPWAARAPMTFEIAEVFKVDRGRIDQVEAVLNTVPYGRVSDIWDRRGER